MGISWSKIWKAITLTCTVIVAVAAVFGILAYLIKPTAKLSAVVEYSDVYWPPTIFELIDKTDELTDEDNIRKAIDRKAIDPNLNPNYSYIVHDFRMYLADGLRELQKSKRESMRYDGFYHIIVTNEGKKACSGVSVKLSYSYLVDVLREDNTHELLKDCLVVKIGDLKPQECVNVLAWSVRGASEHRAKEIRVTHDSGVASVDIRKPVGYFGRWVDKYAFWLFMAFLFVLAGTLCFIGWYLEQEIEEKPQEFDKELQRPKKVEDLTSSSVKDKTK